MLIAIHGVKLYAYSYTWSEAFMLIAIHGVKLSAQCYTWSETICSMLFKE